MYTNETHGAYYLYLHLANTVTYYCKIIERASKSYDVLFILAQLAMRKKLKLIYVEYVRLLSSIRVVA